LTGDVKSFNFYARGIAGVFGFFLLKEKNGGKKTNASAARILGRR